MTPSDPTAIRLLERLQTASRQAHVAGTPLPPEPVLANNLGVSRSRLREALARLESAGLIARRSRTGTVVNGAALDIQTWLTRQEEFTDTLTRLDIGTPSVELLSLRFRQMSEDEQHYFGQQPGCGLIEGRKRFRAGGSVHMVSDYQVPAPGAASLSDIEDPGGPIFDVIGRVLGSTPQWEVARSSAALPTPQMAADLEIDAHTPIFVLDLMGVSANGTRLYRTIENHAGSAIEYGFVRTFD
ncbi:GntR family transcriptional regulator [Nocardia sp. NPDC058658]|uniref:GntR family transcriptional regulator n=1 Tax=Nocardia sp. NPDC058658 TaxID=3346580 RepID=UPI003665237D